MRRQLAGTAQSCEQPVRYYLLTEEEKDGKNAYGVLVEGDETLSIPDITPSRSRIQSLLALMIQGHVTPVTARDVVEDWIVA